MKNIKTEEPPGNVLLPVTLTLEVGVLFVRGFIPALMQATDRLEQEAEYQRKKKNLLKQIEEQHSQLVEDFNRYRAVKAELGAMTKENEPRPESLYLCRTRSYNYERGSALLQEMKIIQAKYNLRDICYEDKIEALKSNHRVVWD